LFSWIELFPPLALLVLYSIVDGKPPDLVHESLEGDPIPPVVKAVRAFPEVSCGTRKRDWIPALPDIVPFSVRSTDIREMKSIPIEKVR
jgi:hypothetical protein